MHTAVATEQSQTQILNLRYKFSDQSFLLPWNRPDHFRLKLWFQELSKSCPAVENFSLYLFGDFWSSTHEQSRVANVYLVPIKGSTADLTPSDLADVHETLFAGYQLAIERFRLVLNIAATDLSRLTQIHTKILEVETGDSETLDITPGLPTVISMPNTIEYYAGDWTTVIDQSVGKQIWQNNLGCLIALQRQSDLPPVDRLTGRERQVFFEPVCLTRLYGNSAESKR